MILRQALDTLRQRQTRAAAARLRATTPTEPSTTWAEHFAAMDDVMDAAYEAQQHAHANSWGDL